MGSGDWQHGVGLDPVAGTLRHHQICERAGFQGRTVSVHADAELLEGVNSRSNVFLNSSRSTGLTKCAANPEASDRVRSASWPYPVTAMVSGGAANVRNRSATS